MIWKIIPEYPDFEISDCGQIRRVSPLATPVGSHGYKTVSLNGESLLVHRLVCRVFHGNPPAPQSEAAHGDGDKLNNCSDNLRWATRQENELDKIKQGNSNRGSRNGHSKLTEIEVLEIRSSNGKHADVAAKYGISPSAVSMIKNRRVWKHL